MLSVFKRFCLPIMIGGCVLAGMIIWGLPKSKSRPDAAITRPTPQPAYLPRQEIQTSGYNTVFTSMELTPWESDASLEDYAEVYQKAIPQGLAAIEWHLQRGFHPLMLLQKTSLFHASGDTASAYQTLEDLQSRIAGTSLDAEWLYTVIYFKGVTALRIGENENCILCRGESSCILPIVPTAIHTNPKGSRLAIQHFTEYLSTFPDDLEVKWLLNLAHMTLGEHPAKVDPRYLLKLDSWTKSEFDVGKFRDVGHLVGVNRLNQSGGAILEDFDNDGLLDFIITCWAPSEPMAFYHNQGNGKFEDRTKAAGLEKQVGGLYCVQTDYNNDGFMDIFIPRGSWLPENLSQRPSLLRNNRDGTFTDVTEAAGLMALTNSTSATWADFDNDGRLDLFVCCRKLPSLLYRNKGDGTFEEVIGRLGLTEDLTGCLGAAWVDIDNDDYPELFVNISHGMSGNGGSECARLFRNNRDGTFTDFTKQMGIDGPNSGFSCWAFDFDNDGWLDIFATTGVHTVGEVVQGLLDEPTVRQCTARLWRNLEGKGFQDVTKTAGLTKVYAPMGSNFGDIDNDGYLDFYLGTGNPGLGTLIPNRLFKNVAGKRFAEVTASSRTGHLQKGHAIAFGDWDRNGTADIFIELGVAIHGDRYHNVLFQNPGHGNNWLSIKLIGNKTNRAAIGARIKLVTAGDQPLAVHRHVSSGSSFGANPLELHCGLGKANRVARLEVHWPTSGTTQVFNDIAANQGIEIAEFASDYRKLDQKPIPLAE
ncbi:MAG: hypothetical protein JWM11_6062 [Planctomycetaceae bacterium]|nr:hypothetical protein [Planctomycetaceae bacterium]